MMQWTQLCSPMKSGCANLAGNHSRRSVTRLASAVSATSLVMLPCWKGKVVEEGRRVTTRGGSVVINPTTQIGRSMWVPSPAQPGLLPPATVGHCHSQRFDVRMKRV